MSHCMLYKEYLDQDRTQKIQSQTHFCVCCLAKNINVVSLSSCGHAGFLNNFAKPDIKPHKLLACLECHSMLKKITEFQHLVQESFELLSEEKLCAQKTNFRTKLKIEKTVDILINEQDNESPQKIPGYTEIDVESNIGSTPENVKLKNIHTALDILNSNNTAPLLGLLSGINYLRNDILRAPAVDNLNVNSESAPSISDYAKTDKNIDMSCFDVDVLLSTFNSGRNNCKRNDLSVQTKPGVSKKPNLTPIKKVKLTKNQLLRERYFLSTSKGHLKYPYKCKDCVQGFNYKENYEDHMKRRHDAKLGSACEICWQYHPVGTLDAHKRRHYVRYICIECYNIFSTRDEAVYHYSKHHTRRFKCPNCGYLAENLVNMRKHRLKKHRFLCRDCGNVFATSRLLKWHFIQKHRDCKEK